MSMLHTDMSFVSRPHSCGNTCKKLPSPLSGRPAPGRSHLQAKEPSLTIMAALRVMVKVRVRLVIVTVVIVMTMVGLCD